MKIDEFEAKKLFESDKFERIPLPFDRDELAPSMSEQTVKFHYDTLHRNYVRKANATPDDDFLSGGVLLHNKFFEQFSTSSSNPKPYDRSKTLIEDHFGSFRNFKLIFKENAEKIRGSGWLYLSKTGEIKEIKNHKPKKDIALIIDMWEHAYFYDYGPDKSKYIDNFWSIINWEIINARL